MTRKVEPRVIDFSNCGFRVMLNTLPRPADVRGPTRFVERSDGSLEYHTGRVPEWRIKRARRILWECKQQSEWAQTQAAFFKHPALKNVPYPVLKQLVKESED